MASQNPQSTNNEFQMPEEVRTYLEELLKEAEITPPDDRLKEEILNELYVRLDNFITTTIIENIPPEYLEEFDKLNQTANSREEIEKFIQEKLPNGQEIFAKASINFRDLYLGNSGVSAQINNNPTN